MKPSLRALLIGSAALSIPQFSSASIILAGWNSFTADASSQLADDALVPGFDTSTVSKGGVASFQNSGSSDNAYGGKDPGLDKLGAAPPYTNGDTNTVFPDTITQNGSLVLKTTNSIVFSVINQSGTSYTLEALMLDAAYTTANNVVAKVEYRIGGGAYQTLTTLHQVNNGGYLSTTGVSNPAFPIAGEIKPNVPNYSTVAAGHGSQSGTGDSVTDSTKNKYSNDYTDFDFLLNMVLASGSTADFKLTMVTGTTDMRVDNVAVTGFTAVPEPGSLLALGCVIGSGAFLRMRRRS